MKSKFICFLVFALFVAFTIGSCKGGGRTTETAKQENNNKELNAENAVVFGIDESCIGKVIGSRSLGLAESGEVLSDKFTLHNIGNKVIVILEARSNCGCLTLDYKKSPILEDQKRVINYTYDSSGKKGEQLSEITINTNIGKFLVLVDLNIKNK